MFWSEIKNKNDFISIGKKVTLAKSEEVPLDGNVIYIDKGICALTRTTKEGHEKVYMYFKPGNLTGFIRHLLPKTQYPKSYIHQTVNTIITKTEVACYLIKKEHFFDLLKENSRYYEDLTYSLAQNLSNVLEHSALVASENAPSKICAMLLEFSEPKNDRDVLHSCFNYAEIGNFLSLHTVTVAKIFKTLKDKQYIEKIDGQLVIKNKEKLLEICNNEYSFSYKK